MKAITIRGLETKVSDRLKNAAGKEGKSVNQFVIDLIKEKLGMQKSKRFTKIHHDLDDLFGKWSEEEFVHIQSQIDTERRIDADLWK